MSQDKDETSRTAVDNVIALGVKRLESLRREVEDNADRIQKETLERILVLKEAGERDVFKDAVVLAAGDFVLDRRIALGETFYLSAGMRHCSLAAVSIEPSARVEPGSCRSDDIAPARRLRALLVVFEERAPK